MNTTALRTVSCLTLTVLLAACGASTSVDQPTRTAGLVETVNGSAQPITTVATATMPAPDCADQGCHGLRIIDANAEAYRYDAIRRPADDTPPQG